MKKVLMSIALVLVNVPAFATCPANIVGNYVGYTTKYVGAGTIVNIENKVFVIRFLANDRARVGIKATVSLDESIGVRVSTGDSKSYSYNASNCTVRIWDTPTGSTASDDFFVVGDSGKTFYGVAQDVGDNETKMTILTKQ